MVSSGFLQEPHGVTTQKTPFFIVTAVKTSNLSILIVRISVMVEALCYKPEGCGFETR
jgi:hypothetical protein